MEMVRDLLMYEQNLAALEPALEGCSIEFLVVTGIQLLGFGAASLLQ